MVRADPAHVNAALAIDIDLPAVAVLGIDNGRVVGSGGLAWGGQRCWIWFLMTERHPSYALPIIRETRRMLNRAVQLGEGSVYTPRDNREPQSEKLLTMLGFEYVGIEWARGAEVEIWRWQWPNSQ
jgi:hypothetical protein